MRKKRDLVILLSALIVFSGCSGTYVDTVNTKQVVANLQEKQPTPTDINYSLERYNLIRRAYWVNGQREKADQLVCEIQKPLGYIVLFSGNLLVGRYVVDGKVLSLNSYLTADTTSLNKEGSTWLADIDGSYGENDSSIFFFTPEGNYMKWTGDYL